MPCVVLFTYMWVICKLMLANIPYIENQGLWFLTVGMTRLTYRFTGWMADNWRWFLVASSWILHFLDWHWSTPLCTVIDIACVGHLEIPLAEIPSQWKRRSKVARMMIHVDSSGCKSIKISAAQTLAAVGDIEMPLPRPLQPSPFLLTFGSVSKAQPCILPTHIDILKPWDNIQARG